MGGNCGKNVSLGEFKVLKEFAGVLNHDHEIGRYHFGTRYGECNVHLGRYLLKNTKEASTFFNVLSLSRLIHQLRYNWCISRETTWIV